MLMTDKRYRKNLAQSLMKAETADAVMDIVNDVIQRANAAIKNANGSMKNAFIELLDVVRTNVSLHNTALPQDKVAGVVRSVDKLMEALRTSRLKEAVDKPTRGIREFAMQQLPSITGMFAAVKYESPLLGSAVDFGLQKIQDRKDTVKEEEDLMKGLDSNGNPTQSDDKQASPQAQAVGLDADGVAQEDTLAIVDDRLSVQTDVMRSLLSYTMEVWGDGTKTLDAILLESKESTDKLTEMHKQERERIRQEEMDAANAALQAEEQQPAPDAVAPKEDNTEEQRNNSFFGRLGDRTRGIMGMPMKALGGLLSAVGAVGGAVAKIPGIGPILAKGGKGLLAMTKSIPGIGLLVSVVSGIVSAFDDDRIKEITGKDSVSIVDRIKMGVAGMVSWIGTIIDFITGLFGFDTDVEGLIEESIVNFNITDFFKGILTSVWSFITEKIPAAIKSFLGFDEADIDPTYNSAALRREQRDDIPTAESVAVTTGANMRTYNDASARRKQEREERMAEASEMSVNTAVSNNVDNSVQQIIAPTQRDTRNTESTWQRRRRSNA